MSRRILVVEDQPELAELLARNLAIEGFEVRTAADGREVVPLARAWKPDLVILDLMLPGLDGFEVLRGLRAEQRQVPVIILSARGEEADKIRGFRLDADQYVTKPFGLVELLERVHALLRRAAGPVAGREPGTFCFGAITVDSAGHTVTRDGRPVALSPKAFALLLALIRRNGAVASRAQLLREVWGYQALVLSRTVDSHVAELRRKLEADAADPRHIITVYKTGYRFQA
ncbi:MAG: response regulator transcription factor [Gemmatimonadales bacterium]